MGGDRLASYTNGEVRARARRNPLQLATGLAAPSGHETNQMSNVIKTHTNMTKLDLNAYGVKELSSKEQMNVVGGIGYFEYSWSGTSNPLIFAFEACANGLKAAANGCIWVYNQL